MNRRSVPQNPGIGQASRLPGSSKLTNHRLLDVACWRLEVFYLPSGSKFRQLATIVQVFSVILLLACCSGAAFGAAPTVELTGLVDLGSLRAACLKVQPGDQSLTLQPGKTAAGITLKALDAKAGWALVEQGTNRLRLRLVNYCSSTPKNAPDSGPVPGPHLRRLLALRKAQAEANSAWANPAGTRESFAPGRAAQEGATAEWRPSAVARGGLAAARPRDYQQAGAGASSLVGQAAAQRLSAPGRSAQLSFASGSGSLDPNDTALSDYSTPTAPPSSQSGGVADSLKQQEEQVRMYGIQAFLAWDMAHRNR